MRTPPLHLTTLAILLLGAAHAAPNFVTSDPAKKTATLVIIANQGDGNAGLNFNGFVRGEKTFVVPVGWKVNVRFENQGSMPHSVLVVPDGKPVLSYDEKTAAFNKAFSKDPLKGVTNRDPAETFAFVANRAGKYQLVCGVIGHTMGGQWLKLEVSKTAKTASFR